MFVLWIFIAMLATAAIWGAFTHFLPAIIDTLNERAD